MNIIVLTIGSIITLVGLVMVLSKNWLARSHLITFPMGFGGKSFEENWGEDKGRKYMFILGFSVLLVGAIILITSFLGINIFS
jgi:hypothetical protein